MRTSAAPVPQSEGRAGHPRARTSRGSADGPRWYAESSRGVLMNALDQQASQRLEELLDRAERLGRRLPLDDLRELARMYRLNSARLAILRSRRSMDPDEIRYLNALCVRAYGHLLVAPPSKLR